MRKNLFKTLALSAVLALSFTACENEQTPLTDTTKLWPAYNVATEKFGFINDKGEWKIDAQYDELGTFSCGLAYAEMGDLEGFVNEKGDFLPATIGELEGEGYFYNGLCPSHNDDSNKAGFINTDLQWAIQPMYEYLDLMMEGLAPASLDGEKIGYINKDADFVIPANYNSADIFSEGMASVRLTGGSKYGYINSKGELVIQPIYHYAGNFNEDLAMIGTVVGELGKYGFINKQGETIIQPMYNRASSFSNGLAAASIDGETMGFINNKGEMTIPAMYDYAYPFLDDLACVYTIDGKCGFINKKGEYVIQPIYDDAEPFHNGLAVVYTSSDSSMTYAYINKKGETIFSWVIEYSNEYEAPSLEEKQALKEAKSERILRGNTNYILRK